VHSVPDLFVFSALQARILGARVILDIHDIIPEFYASKFGTETDSLLYGMLLMVERLSARMANHVIVANDLWHERLIHRATRAGKCTVTCNYPNPEIFHRPNTVVRNGHFVLMYPGSLNWHQGVDVAIRAFAKVKDEIPDTIFRIFGEGPEKPRLNTLIQQLHLEDRVTISDYLPVDKIAAEMAAADLAVVPKRASSPFGNEAASTKTQEFMALGVPVVISRTRIDSCHFDDSNVRFFRSEDEADLANCILALKCHPELRAKLVANATAYIHENNWNVKKHEYLNLVDCLTARQGERKHVSAAA